jgi:ligand-binding sensor domain-containing protein/signal transduction histidine kinase
MSVVAGPRPDRTGLGIALALLALLASAPAAALAPQTSLSQYIIDSWQEQAGLPQKFVLSILQTRDGYLWIGTKGGLARFDGVRFVTYDDRSPEQLREAEVWALAEGEEGALWIATYGGGVSCFRQGRFVTFTTRDGLASDFVAALATTRDGSLWLGTDGGLCRLLQGKFTVYRRGDGLPSDTVHALYADEADVIWIGTTAGLCSLSNGRITRHALALPGATERRITALAGDGGGGVWAAASDGLFHLAGGGATRVPLPNGPVAAGINALHLDPQGTLWIGTEGGLCRYRRGQVECAASPAKGGAVRRALDPLTQGQVQAIHTDREGSLWVGTRVDGLVRLKDSAFETVDLGANGGRSASVATLLEDSHGAMWFGMVDGVKRLKDGGLTTYPLPGGAPAGVIAEDRAGNLWIGSANAGGLYQLRRGKIERAALGSADGFAPRALLADEHGSLWIGTDANGLFAIRNGTLTHYTAQDGLLGNQVRALAADGHGGLWIGTRDGGLSLLHDGRFTPFGPAQGLASSSAQAIFVGQNDAVWVATRRGLSRVASGRVDTLMTRCGLPANFFYQIVGDGRGSIWMTFGRGIVRVSERELNDVADGKTASLTAVTFGAEDGMRSTAMVVPGQPTAWRSGDGRLWFATDRGVVVTDPKTLLQNGVPPPIAIEEITVDKASFTPADDLTVPPGRGDVEIHYTGLSFLAPEKVRFRYRLEGFDRDWVEAGPRRAAYYTNLPPARYVFRVLACNNNGVWNETGGTLAFRLEPHLYQTPWFYAACGLAVALLFWIGHLVRVQEMKAQFAAVLTERGRIARDLHDTLAQGVVGISAQLQAVKTLLASAPAAAAEHLDLAVEMVRHTLVEVRRSVWDIRSQALEGADLASALSETAKQLSAAAPIRVQISGTPRALPKAIENHLLHIGQEALSNAIKHAEATSIELDLSFEAQRIILGVKDDGRGFESDRPLKDQEGHFGLIGMRERVQKLGGELSIRSTLGRGTEVVASVPVP